MKLDIIEPLKYFSPTGYLTASECAYSVFLEKMRGIKPIRMPQTEQMALGSAFDAYIKTEIATELGLEEPAKRLALLLQNVDKDQQHMIAEGNKVCQEYVYWGALSGLMEEGVCDVELQYGSRTDPLVVSGIPMFGFPDARVSRGPLDWKVSGWGSSKARSPKPGYKSYILSGRDKGEHKKYGMFLEEIDTRWATQLFFYNLMFDKVYDPAKVYWGAIDQIIVGRGVASYRAEISRGFTAALWNHINYLWDQLKEGEIPAPAPTFNRCEPWGNPRTCTVECEYYKATLDDPISREIMRGGR